MESLTLQPEADLRDHVEFEDSEPSPRHTVENKFRPSARRIDWIDWIDWIEGEPA